MRVRIVEWTLQKQGRIRPHSLRLSPFQCCVLRSNKENTIYATVHFTIICDLSPATPHNFATCCDQAQLADVDLDNGSLGQDTQLSVHWILWVLLDANDGQLHSNSELWMCDVRLLVAQTHGSNESLELDRSSCEIWSDECGLRDHALPALLGRLLSSLDNLEHLRLANSSHLGQWHAEFGRLLSTLVLDC